MKKFNFNYHMGILSFDMCESLNDCSWGYTDRDGNFKIIENTYT